MQHLLKSSAKKFENSATCTAYEYAFEDGGDMNNAIIVLDGRYPDSGYAMNKVCKEVIYVIKGHGSVFAGNGNTELNIGDMIQIEPQEKYYFVGNLELLIASAPAWYPEQYVTVN